MRTVWQDIMYGCRMLARSPGFSVVVVLILAVGIGVNTTIFTAVKAWLSVWSFPCDRPERIVLLSEQNHPWGIEERLIAPEAFRRWEQRCTSFEAVSCWQAGSLRLHTDGDTRQVPAYRWSPRIFTILGISPPLGRPFGPDEDQPGKDHVAILSHEFWQSQFGADPNILGQVAPLNDEPYRIIGVRSPETGMSEMMGTIWIPLPAAASESTGRWSDVGMLARLKPDKSLAQACMEVDTIAKSMAQTYGGVQRDWTVRAEPLRQWMNKLSRPAFFLHVPVGLVGNVKLLESVLRPQEKPVVYVPFSRGAIGQLSLAVRTSLDAASLTRVFSDTLLRTHPDLTIRRVVAMKDRTAKALSLNWPHWAATYMGVLSIIALVFSATGIYGIMAYAATQRTHEIGVRLALGARTRDVLLMVMRRGLKLTGLGLALGSLAAYGTARVLSRLLYETSPLDSLTLVSVYTLLTVVALLACYLPARRASQLDPMIALRCE
ncbi:MAG: hypothetical protein A2Y76_07635 [Planctomycetes bacterium RBG_13_60_9]|nr:MAG: hypothetical protein A2Y76_07635 [Planctomycetes bacterium RBG_13_60_9]